MAVPVCAVSLFVTVYTDWFTEAYYMFMLWMRDEELDLKL
jgi:hypothetical protein